MAVTRPQCRTFVINYIAEEVSVPPAWITEKTDLRSDLLFDNGSLVALGRHINQAHWHEAYVLPGEIASCASVGDVIDLLYKKAR
jgi:hypothetical protein